VDRYIASGPIIVVLFLLMKRALRLSLYDAVRWGIFLFSPDSVVQGVLLGNRSGTRNSQRRVFFSGSRSGTLRYCLVLFAIVMLFGLAGATMTAPVADFNANDTFGTVPLPVHFSDLSLNTPGSWAWYFGDEDFTEPWTEMNTSSGWMGRRQHATLALPDGSIVLMGGFDTDGNYRNDTWQSKDNGATWTEMNASSGWSARICHSSVAFPDGNIVLMGGLDYNDDMNDVWLSTNRGATWELINASAGWSARWYHSSGVLPDGSIVLTGGTGDSGVTNDTWRSEDRGRTWALVNTSSGWSAREGHSSVVLPDGSIVLSGGSNKNDTWQSKDRGATWVRLNASSGWTGRLLHTSVTMPDGSIVLMGGLDKDGRKNDVWRSADNGKTWTQVPDPVWSARYYHSSVSMPDGSIVLMGGDDGVSYTNDTWRFRPLGSPEQNPSHTYPAPGTYTVTLRAFNAGGYDTLQKIRYITVTPPPPAAAFSGGPLSGTAPLEVTFADESTLSPTGWAWFFGDETYTAPWVLVNASSGWPARSQYSSVVLPDGSIVLTGGYGGPGIKYNDTWRSKDNGATWTLVNASSEWPARYGHNSVVLPDGSIVLMGGVSDSGYYSDVWRSLDDGATWMLMNASAFPWTYQIGPTSVALPDGSIVLIGNFGNLDVWRSLDEGVIWTRTNASAGDVPSRMYSSGVALPDGSIVVMGGNDRDTYARLNDVWRSTDGGTLWIPMNTNAPWSARSEHTSVALPDGSIVLMGGISDSGHENDVWRSADAGATWTKANASAGWTAREFPGSVAMPDGSVVLMGGWDSTNVNDTWRFAPAGSSERDPVHTYTVPGIYQVALQAYNAFGYNSTRKVGVIEVTGQTKIGTFRNGAWYLDSSGNGWWDGPVTDRKYPAFGTTGDIPVAGDWNHNWISEIGVFRNGAWYLDNNGNGWWDGPVTDIKYPAFGTTGDIPVAGNWSGDGKTEIGVFRNGAWYLDYSGNGWWDGPVTDRKYPAFGTTGDIPVAGDWNNDKISEIGVFRNGAWYLDSSGNGWWDGPVTDIKYPAFGTTGDAPVAGDWNHDGISEIGVFRNGAWYLDYSGNGWWDGPVTDRKYPAFGTTGDKPVAGKWI
jgi:uncharacterized delta-60 repeat protein